MKQIIAAIIFFAFSVKVIAQNVGIGITTPQTKLHVASTDTAMVRIDNLTPLAAGVSNGLYFKTGNYFTGAIKQTGVGTNVTRTGIYGFASFGTPAALKEYLSITDAGNVGISATNPTATLQIARGSSIGGTLQIDGTTNASHFNIGATEETYIRGGLAASQVIINDVSSGNIRLAEGGGKVGIGVATPTSPLSFPNTIGKKISLYPGATGDAGFGVFGNELRINSDNVNADITFGHDSYSSGFSEKMRVRGNGNVGIGNVPTQKLDVSGRMRLRNESASVTAGVWLDGPTLALRGFIGALDNNYIGFYGNGGAGWGMLFNENTGQVNIGTTTPATGYLLNVNGKIISEEVRVQLKGLWPDYVFEKNYQKLSLLELEKYLLEHKHLPNIPSAKEVQKEGQHLGEIQRKMLEKIEELSLYVIELKKEIDVLKVKGNN